MNIVSVNRALTTTCVLGVLISTYALYVELAAEARPGYKALCDISEYASCSKVLTSKYAKGLGLVAKESSLQVPNCVYGTIFYCLMLILTTYDNLSMVRLQLVLSVLSLFTCVYLAYILIFILQDICVVCISTYIVSGTIAYLLKMKHDLFVSKTK